MSGQICVRLSAFSVKKSIFVGMMKHIWRNIGFWILVAMVLGVVVGVYMGEEAKIFVPLGTLFIQLIKMLVVPLVAVSIVVGAASLGGSSSAGRIGVVGIGYIIISTLLAILIAIGAGLLFQPGAGLAAESVEAIQAVATTTEQAAPAPLSFSDHIMQLIPDNPIRALAEGNILQIIIFGLFFGFGLSALPTEKRVRMMEGLQTVLDALIWCIGKVMLIAPLGVFGLMAEATGTFGFDVLWKVANLLWVDLVAILVMAVVVYLGSLKLLARVPVGTFCKAMVRPQIIAFSTASSMATLPLTMQACRQMGISQQTTGFVVPLGATINMTGNAIYYTLVAIFFAQFYGIELQMSHYVAITITASLGSIGQAGVPGPTLMVVAVLAAAGIPIEGLPLLYALDRIFDMARTVLNITGDAVCAAVTDRFA